MNKFKRFIKLFRKESINKIFNCLICIGVLLIIFGLFISSCSICPYITYLFIKYMFPQLIFISNDSDWLFNIFNTGVYYFIFDIFIMFLICIIYFIFDGIKTFVNFIKIIWKES